MQSALHPSPVDPPASGTDPSSHCSPAFTAPSPHRPLTTGTHGCPAAEHAYPASTVHVELHPSPFCAFPSSHPSLASIAPFPHAWLTVDTHG